MHLVYNTPNFIMKKILSAIPAHVLFFLGLVVLNIVVYGFSVYDVARSDQLVYLIEVGHRETWWDSVVGTLDLNRKRMFSPGDEILFRPVLYFVLGNARYFFGHQFWMWQVLGIVLHLWVVGCLFSLVRTITSQRWPWLLVAFVSVIYVNMEMVMWHHIHAYMIFVALLLMCLRRIYQWLVLSEIPSTAALAMYTCWLTLGAFTHEVMNVYAFCFGLVFFFSTHPCRKRLMMLSLMVPLLYGGVSGLHFWVTQTHVSEVQTMVSKFHILETFNNMVVAIRWWFLSALVPSELHLNPFTRTMPAGNRLDLGSWWDWSNPLIFCAQVVLGSFVFGFMIGVRQMFKKQIDRRWITLLTVMLLAFAALITLGRSNSRGIELTLSVGLYYGYVFWMILTVLVVSLMRIPTMLSWWQHTIKILVLSCLSIIIIVSSVEGFRMMYAKKNSILFVRRLTQFIEGVVAQHRHEPDFSFRVTKKVKGNYAVPWVKSVQEPERVFTYLETLYPQYYQNKDPKYVIGRE